MKQLSLPPTQIPLKIIKPTVCKRCNTEFIDITQRSVQRRYCEKCKEEVRKNRNKNRHKQVLVVSRLCKYCQQSFTPSKKSTALYCSSECWIKLNRKKIKAPCKECGNKIKDPKLRLYCSSICCDISYHKRQVIKLENLRRERTNA